MSLLYNILPESFDERFKTETLLLRPYQEGDEGEFMRLIKENAGALFPAFGNRFARTRELEDARMQVKQLRTEWDNRRCFDFGVWLQEENVYIGDIALKNFDYKVPKAEIGLYFTNWPDSRPYMEEALQMIIQFAFEALHLNKIYFRCTQNDTFYGELAAACGFVKEGVLRSDYKSVDSDKLFDLSYYGMTRSDFEEQHQAEIANSEAMA